MFDTPSDRRSYTSSTLIIAEKPNHGLPDYARDVAFEKIANRVKGARMAGESLGV